jgi:hypothetical protein
VGNSLSGGLGVRGSMSGPMDDLDFALGLRASGGAGVSAGLAGGGSGTKVREHVMLRVSASYSANSVTSSTRCLTETSTPPVPSYSDVSYLPCPTGRRPLLECRQHQLRDLSRGQGC